MADMLGDDAPAPADPATLRARALEVVEAERYLVLATVSPEGVPWSSPVWFAHDGLAAFYWISRPHRTHSVNITHQPRVGFVVFDSRQPAGTGLAVYAAADVGVAADDELDTGLAVFSERSVAHGVGPWTRADHEGSGLSLYVARPARLWLLPGAGTDERVPVPLS